MIMLVQKFCNSVVLLFKDLNFTASSVKRTIYENNALKFGEFFSAKTFGEQCA